MNGKELIFHQPGEECDDEDDESSSPPPTVQPSSTAHEVTNEVEAAELPKITIHDDD